VRRKQANQDDLTLYLYQPVSAASRNKKLDVGEVEMHTFLDLTQQFFAWKEFVDRQKIPPELSPVLVNSWKRCLARLNPYSEVPLRHLNADHLLAAQVASFDLLSIARPVMEDIYQFIEHSDTIIVLVNSAGIILDLLGDPEMLESAQQMGIVQGTLVSESQVGTNAFGLALNDRIPVSVVGPENFLRRFHDFTGTAAPVFDLSGHLLGALGLLYPAHRHHPHSLGLVVMGARAIEGQRQSDQLLAEQNSRLAQLNVILAANSDGVMVWNSEGVLMHINPAAARIFGLPEQASLGRQIGELICYPAFVKDAIEKGTPFTDVEANLEVEGRSISCVLSLRYVLNDDKRQWVIAIVRQAKDVRRLVQSQVGSYASLTLADIIGESREIRHVRRFIKSAANAQASVFIRGETGTGKIPVASAIHNESSRRDGPFMIFACAAVPSEIAVNELLGFDKGLFSNSPGGRPSKFELAHGGTLYFQDVDALPLEAQGVLLNVIDFGIVQRLGSSRPIEVDVRIIASSSAIMEELIAKGNFRPDLFYRLSSFEIRMPPLRERLDDLPLLVDRIAMRLSRQLHRSLRVDESVIDLLIKYSWPGNVRELEAVLGHAAVQAGFSSVIEPAHLPDYIHHLKALPANGTSSLKVRSLDELEREVILNAVGVCNGNVSEMARLLGIGRTTAWRRLRTYGISPADFRSE
jgi:transcriptional regulator of acetoin/glycerol metabolism